MKRLVVMSHPMGWLLLLSLAFCLVKPMHAAADPARTQIEDVIYRADGAPASGALLISWPAFVTGDKKPVAAGTEVIKLGPDGFVQIPLIPTAGATPSGTIYKVIMKLDDGTTATEYWNVPSTPTATLAQMRVIPTVASASAASQAVIGNKLDRQGDTPVTMGGVRYASQFPGSTATKKLDAAIADCGSAPCVVEAPSTLDAGTPTNLSDNAVLIDERQAGTMNAFGQPDLGQHNGIMWQRTISSPRNGYDGYSTGQFYFEAAKGGHNANPTGKNTFYSFGNTTVSRTPGQLMSHKNHASCYGSGDCIGTDYTISKYGGNKDSGDEGLKGIRLQIGDALLATGTVGAVSGNTITVSASQNWSTVGENRQLINRNAAKKQSANCSIDSVNAVPITFTCAGATFDSWYGLAANPGVCMEVAAAKVGPFNRTMAVSQFTGATTGKLSFVYAGGNVSWGDIVPSNGSATFSWCSTVTDASQWASGKITVANANRFVAGDAVEENVDPAQDLTGIHILAYPTQWGAGRTYGLRISNSGAPMDKTAAVPLYSAIETLGAMTGAPNSYRYLWTHYNGTVLNGGISWHNESATPPSGYWFYPFSDNTAGCDNMLGTTKSGGGTTGWSYCKHATDPSQRFWSLAPSGFLASDDGRFVLGPGGYPAMSANVFVPITNNTAYEGVLVYSPTTWNGNASAFRLTDHGWSNLWLVDRTGNTKSYAGAKTTWYSDAGSTQTAVIDGTTGNAQFAKVCYNSAQTLCDFAGSGAPSNSCTTGSTYRRSDGAANSTFYVCQAGGWAAK